MPIWTNATARLVITVARMIRMEGHTSAGANRKISEIYSSDIRLPTPTDSVFVRIMLQRDFTELARLDSSPEE